MNITDLLQGPAGDAIIGQLAEKMGVDKNMAKMAASAAIPALVGSLANKTNDPNQAKALNNALDKHDGSIFNNLGNAIGNKDVLNDGAKILGHVLGNKQAAVEKAVGQNAGIDAGQAAMVMSQLAPLVMGMLGKQKKEQGLDIGGLAGMLMNQKSQVQKQMPQQNSILNSILDQNGDGNVADDVAKIGMKVFGNLFKK